MSAAASDPKRVDETHGSHGRLEEQHELGDLETLRLLGRAFRYVAPLRGRMAIKFCLLITTLIPFLVLPFPIKIIIDHGILALPLSEAPTPYPFFIMPLIHLLEGRSPTEIILWTAGFQLLLVFLIGAVGTGGGERDQADAYLASGHDQATSTENAANAGFSMGSGILGLFDMRFTIRLTQALNHHYRSRLFERIQSLPMAAFDDERIGDAVYRVMYDTPSITNSVYRIVLTPFASLLFGLLVLAVMQGQFGNHPTIVWAAAASLALTFLVSLPFSALLRRRSSRSRKAGATSTSTLEEGLSNILAVQSLGGEERERSRFDADSWASFSRHRAQLAAGMAVTLIVAIPVAIVVAIAFEYIANLVIEERISAGDFSLLLSYFVMLGYCCVEVGALWIRIQETAVGLQRVFFLMDLPADVDAPDAIDIPPIREGVRLEGVDFDYPDGTPALREVDMEARIGSVTAFAGPAGAGKTTLASLIPRFHRATGGRVLFDGQDIAGATTESIRSQVAFVFQETVLFDATVIENLRLGRPEATEAEVEHAARTAGAHDFIARLPNGYHTRLGRSGGKLSVGQRQRLSIARALVRDAPILILDEPTSALDPDTERALVAALREASRTRLVIVIAHRLSTIRDADTIHFLEDGRIIESGSHDELIRRENGRFRRFVELQTRGAA
ncbi:MAG: ABC transporter ATP-binding protein [Myxococcota bacterium]|nr:ABC transporter ATP-binding protein [Myxococcota bacterium]